jgi:hypothetical protein
MTTIFSNGLKKNLPQMWKAPKKISDIREFFPHLSENEEKNTMCSI